jgi:hypothetical protein
MLSMRALLIAAALTAPPQMAQPAAQKPLQGVYVGHALQAAAPTPLGFVVDAVRDNLLLREGDVVRIAPSAQAASTPMHVGDTLISYLASKKMQHPRTRAPLGVTTEITGSLQVTRADDHGIWARITRAVTEVERGQLVGLLRAPLYLDVTPHAPTVRATGSVVGVVHRLLLASDEHAVFLDRGATAGLCVGDVITVYGRRDTVHPPVAEHAPKEAMATVVIVSTTAESSTALVTDSLWEIAVGDPFVASPSRS